MMEKILIAGAGERGLQLLKILENHEIKVDGFLDNDCLKQENQFCGFTCYPLDYFKDCQSDCVVFISPFHYEALEKEAGRYYNHIVSGRMIKVLFSSPFNAGYEDFIVPIGHYYSTYPLVGDVVSKTDYANTDDIIDIPGVDLNEETQREYLGNIISFFSKLPNWKVVGASDGIYRYRKANPSIPAGDAASLYAMIQLLSPKRVIEVGSGYTSAMFLDVNEFCMNGCMELHFVEPYPETLNSIKKAEDAIHLIEKPLQDIPLDYFEILEAGDVLFMDSTHVSKEGSDVNYLFFEILPRLKSGVYIHFHDIFYPFTYPQEWVRMGRVWNEAYLLRAFLQYNESFEIIYSQNYMQKKYKNLINEKWGGAEPFHGASFWIRKK